MKTRSAMRHCYLLGEHIAHSLSPAMHNAGYAAAGMDMRYGLLDVKPTELDGTLARVRQADCAGCNVTMPYKSNAAKAADSLAEEVTRSGVANVLVNEAGRLFARNVDIDGMVACFARRRESIGRGSAVLLGSGGAAAAAIEALRQVKPQHLVISARNEAAARRLLAASGIAGIVTSLDAASREARAASLVINTTPLGMHPDDPEPLPHEALRPGLLVYDLVYTRPGPTPLQEAAAAAGAAVCDGLTHVYQQALPSFRLLTGHEPPAQAMLSGLVTALHGRQPLDW
ncbi:MAG: hypothetical protein JOZ39_08690, partial [Chloroflexi bacterium]|nr:hypothetical protein [Chloroflexota bacterium]